MFNDFSSDSFKTAIGSCRSLFLTQSSLRIRFFIIFISLISDLFLKVCKNDKQPRSLNKANYQVLKDAFKLLARCGASGSGPSRARYGLIFFSSGIFQIDEHFFIPFFAISCYKENSSFNAPLFFIDTILTCS